MELAKITSKGQITIPLGIRKKLGVKDGDKVLFLDEGDRIIMVNASVNALFEVQKSFAGAAEEAGLSNEQDVINMVNAIRSERRSGYQCE